MITSLKTIATPSARTAVADQVIKHIQALAVLAPETLALRRALAAEAHKVIAEAAAEGIEMELLHIEPVETMWEGEICEDRRPNLDVCILMPDNGRGTVTMEPMVLDADDAEEFTRYMRERIIPGLREIVGKAPVAA